MKRVAKILGADVELGNVLQTPLRDASSNDRAAQLLLAQIPGIPGQRSYPAYTFTGSYPAGRVYAGTGQWVANGYDPQDWGRKFLASSGGCFYVDLGHLESCIPEVRSARDFVAAHHAHLRIAREACVRANAALGPDQRIVVMANNSDRLGHSWGGHLNVLISFDLWEDIFERMYPALFMLAAFQASSILYTGQGKVGSENRQPWVPYQISQRGDFFETLAALQTTFHRPLVNTRDEAHVGVGGSTSELARLHIIFHDTTLTHVSNYLKAGVTQLVLAMLEAGWKEPGTLLDDPLSALTRWGHDPDLRATALLADGRQLTAVEHQWLFARAARRFVDAGEAGDVPEAEQILSLWEDTLGKLERRDFDSLAPRLDWVMKRALIERLLDRNPALSWESPEIQAADLLFANLDPQQGLYWALEAAGGTEEVVSEAAIDKAMREPPGDTRAWPRTMLLRELGAPDIESVNWDKIRPRPGALPALATTLWFDDPRCATWDATLANLKSALNSSAHHDSESTTTTPTTGALQ